MIKVFGGVKYFLVRFAIQCKYCLDTIESKTKHDFKLCFCEKVGIDGGLISSRILGKKNDFFLRNIYCTTIQNKKIYFPLNK